MRNFFLLFLLLTSACSAGKGVSRMEAQAMKNPVEATPKSIASGKNVYGKYCAECHGETGNGVSEKAATMAETGQGRPSDLTDDKWDHGSTDGEIFVNIRDGVGFNGAMKGLDGTPGISDRDMWNVVNYMRTLNAKSNSGQ
jgi:S-disulfanyl-L-cysteine oxidoreductase SoxD